MNRQALVSGKSAKNSTSQVKNNDAEAVDHDSTPETRAQEKNGQSAGASGGTKTLPASGAGSRLRARFDSEVDRGR